MDKPFQNACRCKSTTDQFKYAAHTQIQKYLNEFEMFMYILSCSGKSDEKHTVRGDGVSEDMFYVSVNTL